MARSGRLQSALHPWRRRLAATQSQKPPGSGTALYVIWQKMCAWMRSRRPPILCALGAVASFTHGSPTRWRPPRSTRSASSRRWATAW